MVRPREIHSAFDLAYAICIPLYFLMGFVNFYMFGVFNSGANLLLNFPDSAAVRSYMVPCRCTPCYTRSYVMMHTLT